MVGIVKMKYMAVMVLAALGQTVAHLTTVHLMAAAKGMTAV
jgi:hypothetical protein